MCSTWVSECDTSDIGKKTIFLWTEVKREGRTKQVLNTRSHRRHSVLRVPQFDRTDAHRKPGIQAA